MISFTITVSPGLGEGVGKSRIDYQWVFSSLSNRKVKHADHVSQIVQLYYAKGPSLLESNVLDIIYNIINKWKLIQQYICFAF